MPDIEKAIRILEGNYKNSVLRHNGELITVNELLAILKEAVPMRHGRWVKMVGMMPPEYHGHYECSECQWHMKGLRNSWTREEELPYCPNCGAKMDGERRDGE